MKALLLIPACLLSFVLGMHQHQPPTICHTPAQTHCLWVDGHAEWH